MLRRWGFEIKWFSWRCPVFLQFGHCSCLFLCTSGYSLSYFQDIVCNEKKKLLSPSLKDCHWIVCIDLVSAELSPYSAALLTISPTNQTAKIKWENDKRIFVMPVGKGMPMNSVWMFTSFCIAMHIAIYALTLENSFLLSCLTLIKKL